MTLVTWNSISCLGYHFLATFAQILEFRNVAINNLAGAFFYASRKKTGDTTISCQRASERFGSVSSFGSVPFRPPANKHQFDIFRFQLKQMPRICALLRKQRMKIIGQRVWSASSLDVFLICAFVCHGAQADSQKVAKFCFYYWCVSWLLHTYIFFWMWL